MNRFGRPALAFLPALVLCLFAGAADAQVIPNTVKTAPDVTASRGQIQQYVDAAVKRLGSEDPDEQAKARNLLIDGANLTGAGAAAGQPSAAYLDTYATAAAKSLAPLTAHPDMRVRLNAAIAAARIAEKANNLRLSDVAIRFMNDKSPAVALWGVKAARAMVPAAVVGPANNPLMPSLIQIVGRNPLGPVVNEIYQALSLSIFDAAAPPAQRPNPAQIKAVLPNMLGVFRQRVNAYARGALPADPSVDNLAAEFLTYSPVWTQMTPAQQTQAMQSVSDLLGFAGQYAELMAGNERDALLPLFQRTGKALQVVGETMNLPGVVKAAKDVQGVSSGMDGTEVRNRADAVALALKATPQFAGVKPAAPINMGGEPEPAGTEAGGGADSGAKSGFDGKGGPGNAGRPKAPAAPPLPPRGVQPRPTAPPPGAAPGGTTGRPAPAAPASPQGGAGAPGAPK
jgi:hypothetical protein